jgi:hypothetical protein
MTLRPLALALVHYPVLDRRGEEVTTAVTNLDLHDLARTARTFGVDRLYLVTPVEAQRTLVDRILRHWREGFGASYNPDRREALELVEIADTLDEALARWEAAVGEPAVPILTGARERNGLSFAGCRDLGRDFPLLLVLGTGWGLAPALFERGWRVLTAVRGTAEYNHLPVRAAAAVILDRLRGQRD